MRKQLVIILTLLAFSIVVHAQTNTIYGKDVIISTRDTSSAELTIKNSTRTVQGYLKNASGTGKTMFAFPAWSEITGKPSNFNTTYALSNDVKDSILKRVAIRDTSAMLNPYKLGIIALNADTATLAARFSNVVSLVGTKLNWSDTSSMLNAYKLKDIAHDASLALKINFTDSAGMLNAYRLKDISHDASITALNNDTATLAARFTNVINLANSRQAALGYTPENAANKGAANGYAPLGSDTKIATTYLPSITMNNVFTAATQSAMLALSAVVGDMCVRTDSSISYILQTANPSNPASWVKVLSPAAPVSSVNGFTGSVSLLTSNISEGGTSYYWTAARSRAAQSLTVSGSSGAATYDNTTGVFNIPTYTLAGLGGQAQLNGTGFVKASGTTISYDNSTYLTTSSAASTYVPQSGYSFGTSFTLGTVYNGTTNQAVPTNLIGGYSNGYVYNFTQSQIQSWLGLGTYAYRSSGLAELSGATFTGAISAIGATFSASVDMGFNNQITFGTAPYKFKINRNSAGNLDTYFDDEYDVDNTSLNFRFRTLGTAITALKLLSTGAASMPINISSTSTSSGTLVVGGGVGIAGAVNVGGIISASGNIVTSGNLTTAAYIYGQTTNSVIRLDNTIGALIGYSSTYNNYAYFDANGGGIITNGITRFTINNSGVATLANLAGTGDRMVVANSSGVLSTQAIPGGSDGTYTPTVTNFSGTSSLSATNVFYTKIGSTYHVSMLVNLTTASTGSKGFYITIPSTMNAGTQKCSGNALGQSGATGTIYYDSTTQVICNFISVTAGVPQTLAVNFSYSEN